MVAPLLAVIRSARPQMTLRARAVVEAILLSKGSIGSAESVARLLGLKNRFQLARLLQSDGLPPLHRLTEWVTVLSWVATAAYEGVSLCWMAFRSRRHPSACYRMVKKVTGCGWEDVQAKGSAWVMGQFLKELQAWGRRATMAVAPLPAKPPRHVVSRRMAGKRDPRAASHAPPARPARRSRQGHPSPPAHRAGPSPQR